MVVAPGTALWTAASAVTRTAGVGEETGTAAARWVVAEWTAAAAVVKQWLKTVCVLGHEGSHLHTHTHMYTYTQHTRIHTTHAHTHTHAHTFNTHTHIQHTPWCAICEQLSGSAHSSAHIRRVASPGEGVLAEGAWLATAEGDASVSYL